MIYIDSREQRPYSFRLPVRVVTLDVGDYLMHGPRGKMLVERKSYNDLFHTFTKRRDAIRLQLKKMGKGYEIPLLVVEASMAKVARGHPRTRINGQSMLDTIIHWCGEVGIIPLFCASRAQAEDLVNRLFERHEIEERAYARKDAAFERRKSRVYK